MPIISDGNNQTGDQLSDKHTTVGQVEHTGSYVLSGSTGSVLNVKEGLLYLSSSNKVGIGTTNPSNPLHVYTNSSDYVVLIDNDAGSSAHGLKVTSDGSGSGTNIFDLESGSTNLFRVRGDGRVGIGKSTSLPSAKLTVSSSNADSDLAIAHKIHHIGDSDTSISFGTNIVSFEAGGSTKLTVDGSTGVGIVAAENINKKAISLDGSNDHVLVSDQDDYSFTNGSNDLPFSLSAWVYVGDISSDDGPFISKANFSTGGTEFLFKHANGKLQFFLYDNDSSSSGDSIRTQAPSATLSNTTWHHVVATYSGNGSQTGIKVYTDGSQTTSTQSENGSYSRLRNTSTPVVIGATQDLANANRVFEDRIADCVVFNKELSSAEVTEIYNSGNVMNVRNHSAFSDVISWWKMGDDQDTDSSNGIIDYVSGYHGTLTNGASIIEESGLSSDKINSLNTNTSGSLGIGIESPEETLHVYGNTKLEGPLFLKERTYDPSNPSEGGSVIWMSNGNGTGDDGDIMIKITVGGVTKTVTLVDFSSS